MGLPQVSIDQLPIIGINPVDDTSLVVLAKITETLEQNISSDINVMESYFCRR